MIGSVPSTLQRFSLHGTGIGVTSMVRFLAPEIEHLWPMAQLLRARGLYLLPAASVAFADRSFLLITPFGIEPELTTLIRGGYRIIGQSWTAVKEYEGRFSMMNFPGYVQRSVPPGMRLSGADSIPTWIDLMHEHYGAEQRAGWCDAVLIVQS